MLKKAVHTILSKLLINDLSKICLSYLEGIEKEVLSGKWGSEGTGPGEFRYPKGIAISFRGDFFIADSENRRIQVFTSQGRYLREWKLFDNGRPSSITISSKNEIYVTDDSSTCDLHRVQVYTLQGNYIRGWNTGSSFGRFHYPCGITVLDDLIYLKDTYNNIFTFSPEGKCLQERKMDKNFKNIFNYPSELAYTSDGTIYMIKDHNIQVYTSEGSLLRSFGSYGDKSGEFRVPYAIAISSRGRIYIVDATNHRVQIFITILL